jgi:hypothetical protein
MRNLTSLPGMNEFGRSLEGKWEREERKREKKKGKKGGGGGESPPRRPS